MAIAIPKPLWALRGVAATLPAPKFLTTRSPGGEGAEDSTGDIEVLGHGVKQGLLSDAQSPDGPAGKGSFGSGLTGEQIPESRDLTASQAAGGGSDPDQVDFTVEDNKHGIGGLIFIE